MAYSFLEWVFGTHVVIRYAFSGGSAFADAAAGLFQSRRRDQSVVVLPRRLRYSKLLDAYHHVRCQGSGILLVLVVVHLALIYSFKRLGVCCCYQRWPSIPRVVGLNAQVLHSRNLIRRHVFLKTLLFQISILRRALFCR